MARGAKRREVELMAWLKGHGDCGLLAWP